MQHQYKSPLGDIRLGEDAKRVAEELTSMGSGLHRVVYPLDENTVLKLAKEDYCREMNLREAELWQEEQHPNLAPVLACAEDGSWLIMRRAEPIDITKYGYWEAPEEFSGLFARFYLEDDHNGNIGYIAGMPVLIDSAM